MRVSGKVTVEAGTLAGVTDVAVAESRHSHQHGVIVAMGAGKGEFNPPQVVLSDLAFDAGGWRVERHVRVPAKLK